MGASGPPRDDLSVDALAHALRATLQPEVAERAQALANRIEPYGARIAAGRLAEEFG